MSTRKEPQPPPPLPQERKPKCLRGYRRVVLQFRELGQFLRGNPAPYTSVLPSDVEVIHVIEDSGAVQGCSIILSSGEWEPMAHGETIPTIEISMEMYQGPGMRPWITAIKAWGQS